MTDIGDDTDTTAETGIVIAITTTHADHDAGHTHDLAAPAGADPTRATKTEQAEERGTGLRREAPADTGMGQESVDTASAMTRTGTTGRPGETETLITDNRDKDRQSIIAAVTATTAGE